MHEKTESVANCRVITVCDKKSYFFIKFLDGEYLVEKFIPNVESEYGLYDQTRIFSYRENSEGKFYKISLDVPPDVVYWQIENNKLHDALKVCNTFCHMKSMLNIEMYLAEAIVRIEDEKLYEVMQNNSISAEEARVRYEQRILELAKTN